LAQEAPETVIIAQDEASLYLQATTAVVWFPRGQRPVVRLDPGRKHCHFYGALNLHTGEEIVMRTARMTAETTALYLQRILHAYPDKPLLLLWDRAPWHRGAAVQQVLNDNPRLEVMFFPPAAPELNPQEHVWKNTREHISHNHRFAKLDVLADEFEAYLQSTTFPSSLLDKYRYHSLCMMSK